MSDILCPWCGGVMEPREVVPGLDQWTCVCTMCRARSPVMFFKVAAVRAAEIARKPKAPLTLREVTERVNGGEPLFVYVEDAGKKRLGVGRIDHSVCYDDGEKALRMVVLTEAGLKTVMPLEKTYGVRWRCWAENPTDEDRAAAKWKR